MDLSLTFSDDATPALTSLTQSVNRADVNRVMYQAVAGVIQSYLLNLDTQRHQSPVPGPGFYAQAAQSISEVDLDTGGFTVSIAQPGFAQRYYGGAINAGSGPNGARWLTIPASPAALGHRAGDFTSLKCIFFRGLDLGALVQAANSGAIPDEQGRPPVLFWLKRSVTQAPDPTVLPDPADLQAAAYGAADTFLTAAWPTGDSPPVTVAAANP